jgi:hypothetical protein
MAKLPHLAATLRDALGHTADRLARATGFLQRHRKLSGAAFVQALVFGWMDDPDASLAALARSAAAVGCPVAPQSLDARFTEPAAALLEGVLGHAMGALLCGPSVERGLLARFDGVYLLDTTVVALPPEMDGRWRGVGGRTPEVGRAALKVEARLDLATGAIAAALLPGRSHDQAGALAAEPVPAGALQVADLGYFSLDRFAEIGAGGGFWLSRLKVGTDLTDADGGRLDVVALLRGLGGRGEAEVWLGATHRLRCRLVAQRMPPEVAAERRRRLRRSAQRKGRSPSAAQLARCAWTVLVTNAAVSASEALALYRSRWQVELLFKRWKSLGGLSRSRSTNPWRVICEVYTKLLVGLVAHWVTAVGLWHRADRSADQAWQVVSAHARHVAVNMGSERALRRALRAVVRELDAGCRTNTRRRHPNTWQRLEAVETCALT